MNSIHYEIEQLEQMVLNLVGRIEQVSFEELVTFTNEREKIAQLIMKRKDSLTTEDKARLQKLSKFDESILSKMDYLKAEASQWLLKQGVIQEQKSAYNASYTPESMFFDRKN
ncbi:hypothetical protein DX902_02685 [Paenibacillus jamilae]|uniref:hypothetical protein n=1 Tax=Paenibacillus TaxID=44249 RepID=UPI000E3C8B65|nr:hypothetical protein [Paenibacillus jamilae]RFT99212.1 hypothetical protein DX902_02685 [Paenibacillus jamilae]